MIEVVSSIVDPFILAIDLAKSRKDAIAKIKTILNWNKLSRNSFWAQCYLPTATVKLLEQSQSYPLDAALQATLSRYGLEEIYSLNDLRRAVGVMLSAPSLDNKIFVEDVLWTTIATAPDCSESHPEPFFNELIRILLRLVLISNTSRREALLPHYLLITIGSSTEIDLTANLELVIPETSFLSTQLPTTVNGQASIFRSEEQLLAMLEPGTIWACAACPRDLKFAIQLRCRELLNANSAYSNWSNIPAFLIGSGFMHSLESNESSGMGRFANCTLDTVSRVILGLDDGEIKPFRVSRSSSEIRIRSTDRATAHRVHITESGLALRLMMWKLSNGTWELANIGRKGELHIDTGSENAAV